MIYSPLIKKACDIMYDAHKEDVDKGGYPYVMHPLHLAEQMKDEASVCVALLHDVIEDHGDKYTFDILKEEGFGEDILDALRLLTHPKGMPYMEYVEAISRNPIARKVKMADLRHNMDTSRVDGQVPPKMQKYVSALELLESAPE